MTSTPRRLPSRARYYLFAALVLATGALGNWIFSMPAPGSVSAAGPGRLSTATIRPRPGVVSPVTNEASGATVPLDQLRDRRDLLRQQVQALYTEGASIRQDHSLFDPNPDDPSVIIQCLARGNPIGREGVVRLQASVDQLREKLDAVKALCPKDHSRILELLEIDDPELQQAIATLDEAALRLAAAFRVAGTRPGNFPFEDFQRSLESQAELVNARITQILKAQHTKLQIEEVTLASAQKRWRELPYELHPYQKAIQQYVSIKADYLRAKAEFAETENRYQISLVQSFPADRIRDWRPLRSRPHER